MKRSKLRQGAALRLIVPTFAAVAATAASSGAQTWQWKYVTRTANAPPLTAQSTVTLGGGDLRMTYTVPLGKRQVVIESCHAPVHDIERVSLVHTLGRSYLLVQLDPTHPAACASGPRPAVALPTDDEAYVAGVVAVVNGACCGAVARASAVSPHASAAPPASSAPSPSPSPSASPAPSASAPPTHDDVETADGTARIRVENDGDVPLRIRGVRIFDCRGVASGCGPTARETLIDPHATQTIATIVPAAGANAQFRYRYVAAHGPAQSAHVGLARVAAAPTPAPSAAEAAAIVPPHLLKRGSSRLAIGETGTALVRLMIGENGTPLEATIVSISNRRLSAAAIETAVSSTYAPATQNGKPVAAKYVATFSFNGEDPALSSIPVWKRSPLPIASASPAAAAQVTPTPAAPATPTPLLPPPPPTPPQLVAPSAAPSPPSPPAPSAATPSAAPSAPPQRR